MSKKSKKSAALLIATLLVALLTILPSHLIANSPPFIPIQGYLTDGDGNPVDGDVNVHFAIYDAEVGGNMLWYEMQSIVVDDGFFITYLGEVERIDMAMFRDNSDLWLGVQVESDSEMDRVYLGSTPFSGYAQWCGNIPSHTHPLSDITGGENIPTGPQSCSGTDKVIGIDISGALICAADNDTTYLAGSGLILSSQTFSVDTSVVQSRITESCPEGSSIREIFIDGSVMCETDDGSSYLPGRGLFLTGNTFSVDMSVVQARVTESCPAGSSIREITDSGSVVCELDDDTTYDGNDFIQNQSSVVQGANFKISGTASSGLVGGAAFNQATGVRFEWGEVHIPNFTGIRCATVNFSNSFSQIPYVLATINHRQNSSFTTTHDSVTSWLEEITTSAFKVCVRETDADDSHDELYVHWLAVGS